MMLDAECLYEAKLENVERLAQSLGVRLPPQAGSRIAYSRKLVRLVLKAMQARPNRERERSYRLS
ncbi:MAG: hypothetical protein ABJE95_16650 [Byssovorax sp.]